MPASDPSTMDLLRLVSKTLESNSSRYFVTGSIAGTMYSEPRFTHDVDIAIWLRLGDCDVFAETFVEPDWYLSVPAMYDALEHDGQFNVIHNPSGFKVDFMCAADTPFNHSRFARVKRFELEPGLLVPFAAPEDVMLMKLVYYQEGGSDKHLRDIAGIMQVSPQLVDLSYMDTWAQRLKVADLWGRVKDHLRARGAWPQPA